LVYQAPAGPIEIRVNRVGARPGAEFMLVRQPRLVAIEKLQRNMEVQERGRQSGIISVSLEDSDPARATGILQQVARQYLGQNELRISEGAEKQLAFLNRQLPELRQAVERSEQLYNEARNRRGTIDIGEEARGLLQLSIVNKTTMMELDQKKAELATRYQPEHPLLQGVNEKIRLVNREIGQVNAKIKRLPQVEQEIVRLQRDLNVNTEVYTNVMNAAQQLRLASASKVGNIRLLDAPETPVKPVKPRKAIVVFSAAVIGVLLGLLVALMRKGLRGRVYSPGEIEQELGLPVSGIILHSSKRKGLFSRLGANGNQDELLPRDAHGDGAVEGLRRLQSYLHSVAPQSLRDAANDVDLPGAPAMRNAIILVAGPTPGVGKSFVSSNFAVVLSTSGKKVLLIDADLRTGGLHRQFGLERGKGLAEAILGAVPLEDTIHRGVFPNLDFMSTGRLSPMPTELLSSRNLGSLLASLASRYDAVVIDTAPVLAVADTLIIAPYADILFNVVRSGVTTINEIDEVDKQLRRAGGRPGTVIYNDMKSRQSHYGYSSAYG
jgi:tyrosine-protein kinase Etk/Wzc